MWRARDIDRVEVAGTEPVGSGEPVTFLVLGADGPRDDGVDGMRVDTILLARLDPSVGSLSLLSLPRDLMVTDPAGDPVTINSLADDLGGAGRERSSTRSVSRSTMWPRSTSPGSPLSSTASAASTSGSTAPRGTRAAACTWTSPGASRSTATRRSRWSAVASSSSSRPDGTWQQDPYSDLRRIENQRIVVTAALLGLDGLGWSPGEMRDQVEWAVDHLTIDDGLSLDDLVQLGRAAASLGAEDVTGATLPVVPDPLDQNRLAADPAAAPAAVAAFVAGDTTPANTPAGVGPPPPVTDAAPVVAPC